MILAFDCSQIQAIVCLLDSNFNLVDSLRGSTSIAHSEGLMALVDSLLKRNQIDENNLDKINGIGVGIGPGSFTGLRIGVATARAFAQAISLKCTKKIPVYPFSSLQALELSQKRSDSQVIIVANNAYQGQLFIRFNHQDLASEPSVWIQQSLKKEQEYLVCGGAADSFLEASKLYNVKKSSQNEITAEAIALCVKLTESADYQKVLPNYIRPSQAEIKLAELAPKNQA
ncbi:MAG: tRNA (adenosine(37)-N6)-threonylcarbamoyltransferase complex dimerization subunit type 1 TsaB [Bacteriovoracia bacterium]